MVKKIIVDSDFNLDTIKDDFENYSLFSENKFILFNITAPLVLLVELTSNKHGE